MADLATTFRLRTATFLLRQFDTDQGGDGCFFRYTRRPIEHCVVSPERQSCVVTNAGIRRTRTEQLYTGRSLAWSIGVR